MDESIFASMLNKIVISYQQQEASNLAFSDKNLKDENGQPAQFDKYFKISINIRFQSRLQQIQEGSEEYINIICQIAFLIMHEIGHLLLRWKGFSKFS
ncbi:MAG: hypothetical protein KDC82_06205 [Bacteroidetes bacterium]|nr:hypothetical protein [Bacteroidota bacterium]